MAGLRERLGNWQNPFELKPLPPPETLVKTVEAVRRDLGRFVPREPDRYSLEETYQVLAQNPDLARVPVRHLRRAPWVLFAPLAEGELPLADRPGFLQVYLSRLQALATASPILTLAHVFLRVYPWKKPYFQWLLNAIRVLLPLVNNIRGRRFREQAEIFHLLETEGPQYLARRLIESQAPEALLEEAGLTGQLAASGFVDRTYSSLLNDLRSRLQAGGLDEVRLERVLSFSIDPVRRNGHDLRFPGQRVALAEALLLPFVGGEDAGRYKTEIREFLLAHYGDPRLPNPSTVARWQGVEDAARSVMFRWLVENTLEDFFRLLDYSSTRHDRDADRQWPYRRAFWSAYLREGCIGDAWVALGEQVAQDARQHLSDLAGSYARLERGYNVRPTHTVLLMRIGDLVITEWSHMGKYRVWHIDNPAAPKFYQPRYGRQDVISEPDFEQSHTGAASGGWQSTLAGYIREHTGISLNYRQFMPDL